MGRPLKTLRPVSLNLSLDEDVAAKLELELWSELEGKVPFGAKRDLINKLLRTHFRSMAGKRAQAKLAMEAELKTSKLPEDDVPQVTSDHWAGNEA